MRSFSAAVLLVVSVVLLGSVGAYAQLEVHKLVADVPNAFTVAGTQLPAGRYEFELPGVIHKSVIVRSLDGKHSASGLIVTGIASSNPGQPRLVFDTVEGKYILAEVWMPGHDGFLIAGFRNDSEHKHSSVKFSQARS